MEKEQINSSPRWVKIFLAVNLFLLTAFVAWEIASSGIKSEEEVRIEKEMEEAMIRQAMEKNPEPKDIAGTLGPEVEYTINATELERWAHYSFSTGKLAYDEKIKRDSLDWDIALRRAKIVTNGGATNPNGKGGAVAMPAENLGAVATAPTDKYALDEPTENISETKNPVLDRWYKYDFWNHRLNPKREVYVVRTADGHYAKVKIVGYYCGTVAGCYTIRYVYQGSGSASFSE